MGHGCRRRSRLFTLAFAAASLHLQLGAARLLALLAAMYGSALIVGILFGMHHDDRELLRHIWAQARETVYFRQIWKWMGSA